MEIVKNQKCYNQLTTDNTIWNSILDVNIKIIVAYGSNGRGKSTIKDLFQKSNLHKNFELMGEEQSNNFYTHFGQSNFMVYDEIFVNSFVYSGDGLKSNQIKIIMKTDEINIIINSKRETNELISRIINNSRIYLNKIENIRKVLSIKATGNVTVAQKRFATRFISGDLPHNYNDVFNIPDPTHRSWWFEGLGIYKRNTLTTCPWCKSDSGVLVNDIQEQIQAVDQVNDLDSKLFSDKDAKIRGLEALQTDYPLSQNVTNRICELINKIKNSLETDKEQEIIDIMKEIRICLDSDEQIFEEIISKVKHIDNVLAVERTDLINRLSQLSFFESTHTDVVNISNEIDNFISNNQTIVTNIQQSNQELIDSIGESEIQINELLTMLGLKYSIEIKRETVINSGLTDTDKYVSLKSSTGIDVSSELNTTLSYGEKSTLAFAIFIQQIRNESDRNTIIIFDDPISSYDIFRRYTTISVLNTLSAVDYKKMLILTHESSFLKTIISNIKIPTMKKLLLNEKSESEIELVEIDSNFSGDISLYKSMIDGSNANIHLSQSVLALRQLHDLYKDITGSDSNLSFYNYICKLVHYRKDENTLWSDSYIIDIKKIYDYFGLAYNEDIERIQNEIDVYTDIDNLLDEIIAKDVYNISLEDLCSFRMISESAVRNESTNTSRFKKSKSSLWKIKDSNKRKKLEGYKVLLNSMSHVDDDETNWLSMNLEDLKAIPRMIVTQIINILR